VLAGSGVASPAPPLRLQLFGPLEAWLGDSPLPRLRSRKSLWLLALLALRQGAAVERDWLAGLLWPDRADSQALRNSLSELRRALGPEAFRLRSPTVHSLSLSSRT
jgi:DNA-binding SARP family transcriptional activator